MGLVLVGGLKLEVEVELPPSVAYFLFGTGLVIVRKSLASSWIFVFFFKVHWFCLANVSAVVSSGLSTSCWDFSLLLPLSCKLLRHKLDSTDTELANGRSITRSGVWLCLWAKGSDSLWVFIKGEAAASILALRCQRSLFWEKFTLDSSISAFSLLIIWECSSMDIWSGSIMLEFKFFAISLITAWCSSFLMSPACFRVSSSWNQKTELVEIR